MAHGGPSWEVDERPVVNLATPALPDGCSIRDGGRYWEFWDRWQDARRPLAWSTDREAIETFASDYLSRIERRRRLAERRQP
jgi:hypothetical protein